MNKQRQIRAYLMLLPALALLVAFTHYPAVATRIDSFTSTPKPNRPGVFVGLDDYASMIDDPIFWQALRNNLWFALATIPLFVIFYLGAIHGISPSLREAAAPKGAGRWFFFRRVLWPLLKPTTIFVLVNAVINAFRMVDHVVVMTHGGPDNATSLLLYHLYEVGFRYWDQGYAAAITVVLLGTLAYVALLQFLCSIKRRITDVARRLTTRSKHRRHRCRMGAIDLVDFAPAECGVDGVSSR